MKLSELGLLCLACVLLLATGFSGGMYWKSASYATATAKATKKSDDKLAAVSGDLKVCLSVQDSQGAALDVLQRQAADRMRQLNAAKAVVAAAMTERDALQAKLARAARQQQAALTKVIHDTPDCHALADLPVCPAVAQRLWGDVADPDTP